MRSQLHKILILILSSCFLISATKADIGSSRQTFFDDYDTYLPADQLDLPVTKGQKNSERVALGLHCFYLTLDYESSLWGNYYCSFTNIFQFRKERRKIFLDNCSLLI